MDNFIKALAHFLYYAFEGVCFAGCLIGIYFAMVALAG